VLSNTAMTATPINMARMLKVSRPFAKFRAIRQTPKAIPQNTIKPAIPSCQIGVFH
jgi:hypothetical protein